jgi:hypothetical protein
MRDVRAHTQALIDLQRLAQARDAVVQAVTRSDRQSSGMYQMWTSAIRSQACLDVAFVDGLTHLGLGSVELGQSTGCQGGHLGVVAGGGLLESGPRLVDPTMALLKVRQGDHRFG